MRLREKSVLFVATGCFAGNIPFAPGTFGTLIGIPICFLLSAMDMKITIICIIVFILAAIFIAHEAEKILKKNDPGAVVIDEIAGIVVALAGLPFNTIIVFAGFVIFRLLDIFKPFPIKYIEEKMSGGAGIVMDDVVAGIMTNAIMRIFIYSGGLM